MIFFNVDIKFQLKLYTKTIILSTKKSRTLTGLNAKEEEIYQGNFFYKTKERRMCP